MRETAVQNESDTTENRLITAWADFTKSYTVYPPTNVRVRKELDQLVESIQAYGAGSPTILITVHPDCALVNRVEIDTADKPNVHWLKQRLDAAALAGVAFESTVDSDALLAFTQQLVAVANRREPVVFEEFWHTPIEGLQPLDRRFDAGGLERGAADSGPGTSTMDSAEGKDLVERLEAEPDISTRIHELQHTLISHGDHPELAAIDLIAEIVDMFPGDLVREPEQVRNLTQQILDAIHEHLRGPGASWHDLDRRRFEELMLHTARLCLRTARPEHEAARVETPAKRYHDDEIQEDLPALLEEVRALPVQDDEEFMAQLDVIAEEQLAVYLRYLIHQREPAAETSLARHVSSLLAEPEPALLRCLQAYLTAAEDRLADTGDAVVLERLLEFLARTGLLPRVRECGWLTLEHAIDGYPKHLAEFLGSLDWRRRLDPLEARELCRGVGTEALLSAATRSELQRADERVATGILRNPCQEFLPFVHLILETSGTRHAQEAVWFLKKLHWSRVEAIPLTLQIPPEDIPVSYLSHLAACAARADQTSELQAQAASLLAKFLRRTAGRPDAISSRVRAIAALAKIGGRPARGLLRHLALSKRWLVVHREPPAIRRAALAAIQRLD